MLQDGLQSLVQTAETIGDRILQFASTAYLRFDLLSQSRKRSYDVDGSDKLFFFHSVILLDVLLAVLLWVATAAKRWFIVRYLSAVWRRWLRLNGLIAECQEVRVGNRGDVRVARSITSSGAAGW